HPIREITAFSDFHRAEDREIDMPAADHAETIGGREIACRLEFGDRLLAGIDKVGVFLPLEGKRSHAEHAVLSLQLHIHAGRDEIRNERWNADPEIDIKSIAQFRGRARRHLIPGPGHCECLLKRRCADGLYAFRSVWWRSAH